MEFTNVPFEDVDLSEERTNNLSLECNGVREDGETCTSRLVWASFFSTKQGRRVNVLAEYTINGGGKVIALMDRIHLDHYVFPPKVEKVETKGSKK